jgi:hypothetical protein
VNTQPWPGRGAQGDVTAHATGQLARDGQTQPRPAMHAGRAGVALDEFVEDPGSPIRRQPGAGVLDLDGQVTVKRVVGHR